MLVSGYFSSKFSHPADDHPELQQLRENLHKCSEEDGLFLEMGYLDKYFRDMRNWCWSNTNVICIAMEHLFSSAQTTKETMRRTLVHMGLKIEETVLSDTLQQYSFESLTKRKQGQENEKHHFRKGVAGDWANHFTPKVSEEFKRRYNDILKEYGYTTDGAW